MPTAQAGHAADALEGRGTGSEVPGANTAKGTLNSDGL